MVEAHLQYLFSAREYELLHDHIVKKSSPISNVSKHLLPLRPPSRSHDHNAAAFRSALRLFIATKAGLKSLDVIYARLLTWKSTRTPRPSAPLVASSSKLALSLASILFFHRILFRFFTRLRLQLLHEKVRRIRQSYPKLFAALTARATPAIGASLAGLALGICPADQLRITIAIYTASRGLEYLYDG